MLTTNVTTENIEFIQDEQKQTMNKIGKTVNKIVDDLYKVNPTSYTRRDGKFHIVDGTNIIVPIASVIIVDETWKMDSLHLVLTERTTNDVVFDYRSVMINDSIYLLLRREFVNYFVVFTHFEKVSEDLSVNNVTVESGFNWRKEKVWLTLLLKSWIDKDNCSALLLMGCPDNLSSFKVRNNKRPLEIVKRYDVERIQSDCDLKVKRILLCKNFPFKLNIIELEVELQGHESELGMYKPDIVSMYGNVSDYLSVKKDWIGKEMIESTIKLTIKYDKSNGGYHPRMTISIIERDHWNIKSFKLSAPLMLFWMCQLKADEYGHQFSIEVGLNIIIALALSMDTLIDTSRNEEQLIYLLCIMSFGLSMLNDSFLQLNMIIFITYMFISLVYSLYIIVKLKAHKDSEMSFLSRVKNTAKSETSNARWNMMEQLGKEDMNYQ